MEFSRCSLFVTFVVLTVDQFVVRDDGPLEQQKQDSHVCFLHQGNTESRKTLEQKFIFQIGTLNPNGINERFSFN